MKTKKINSSRTKSLRNKKNKKKPNFCGSLEFFFISENVFLDFNHEIAFVISITLFDNISAFSCPKSLNDRKGFLMNIEEKNNKNFCLKNV